MRQINLASKPAKINPFLPGYYGAARIYRCIARVYRAVKALHVAQSQAGPDDPHLGHVHGSKSEHCYSSQSIRFLTPSGHFLIGPHPAIAVDCCVPATEALIGDIVPIGGVPLQEQRLPHQQAASSGDGILLAVL
jgi:hypothetical protein